VTSCMGAKARTGSPLFKACSKARERAGKRHMEGGSAPFAPPAPTF